MKLWWRCCCHFQKMQGVYQHSGFFLVTSVAITSVWVIGLTRRWLRMCAFPAFFRTSFPIKTVCFATNSQHICLDCFYLLVLWEGDTKVLVLCGHEFHLHCSNTVTSGNTHLASLNLISLCFTVLSVPLPVLVCLPLTSPSVSPFHKSPSVSLCRSFVEEWGWKWSRREKWGTTGQVLALKWLRALFEIACGWIAESTKGKILLFHPVFVFRLQCSQFCCHSCCKSTIANSQFNHTSITTVNVKLWFLLVL